MTKGRFYDRAISWSLWCLGGEVVLLCPTNDRSCSNATDLIEVAKHLCYLCFMSSVILSTVVVGGSKI